MGTSEIPQEHETQHSEDSEDRTTWERVSLPLPKMKCKDVYCRLVYLCDVLNKPRAQSPEARIQKRESPEARIQMVGPSPNLAAYPHVPAIV